MSFLSDQAAIRDAIFAAAGDEGVFAALGASPERWQVYRRMVRARFAETIEHGFERLVAIVGRDHIRAIIWRFLAEEPPRSQYLRDVPGEFLRFFERRASVLARAHGLPPYALDLARFEWAELETAYGFEELGAADVAPLEMSHVAILSPAHRLVDVDYPVHRLGTDGGDVTLAPEPFSLCLYRDPKTHEVAVLELTPVTARMLALMEQRTMSLTEVVQKAAAACGTVVDVVFVEALSAVLADLIERGVLLGSLVPQETS